MICKIIEYNIIKSTKYYSNSRGCWETEYIIFSIFKIYKLSKFLCKNRYTLFKSKSITDKIYKTKPYLNKLESIEEFGSNRWTYPVEPYKYEVFSK